MKSIRRDARGFAHHFILLLVIVAVGAGGAYYVVSSHADTPTTYTSANSGECVKSLAATTAQTIDSLGNTVGTLTNVLTGTSTLAQKLTYALGGDLVNQILPPSTWSPLKATAQELDSYGFPERPTDPSALADWTDAMSHYTGAGDRGMCEMANINFAPNNIAKSPNWSGAEAISIAPTAYTSAAMTWRQPAFTNACGVGASYGVWPGIGGDASWNPPQDKSPVGLIQDGVGSNANSSGTITTYGWWEVLTATQVNRPVRFIGSASGKTAIKGNHIMYASTKYKTSKTGKHSIVFFLEDKTTGKTWNATIATATYKGLAIEKYYNGHTAEAITEAPALEVVTSNGKKATITAPLLKPVAVNKFIGTSVSSFHTNGVSASVNSTTTLNQVHDGHTIQTSSYRGKTAGFTDTWNSCFTAVDPGDYHN